MELDSGLMRQSIRINQSFLTLSLSRFAEVIGLAIILKA